MGQTANNVHVELADWFDYHLENDPRFCEENGVRPRELRAGKAIRIEDLKS